MLRLKLHHVNKMAPDINLDLRRSEPNSWFGGDLELNIQHYTKILVTAYICGAVGRFTNTD